MQRLVKRSPPKQQRRERFRHAMRDTVHLVSLPFDGVQGAPSLIGSRLPGEVRVLRHRVLPWSKDTRSSAAGSGLLWHDAAASHPDNHLKPLHRGRRRIRECPQHIMSQPVTTVDTVGHAIGLPTKPRTPQPVSNCKEAATQALRRLQETAKSHFSDRQEHRWS